MGGRMDNVQIPRLGRPAALCLALQIF